MDLLPLRWEASQLVAAADREVGGDEVELVALGGADDERVAQARRPLGGGQHAGCRRSG